MQTPENNRDREQDALEAPPELVSALKRLPKRPIFISPTVDEAILHAARRQLSRHKELLVVGADVRRREFKPSSRHLASAQSLPTNENQSGRGQPHSKTQASSPARRVPEGFGVRLSSAAFFYAGVQRFRAALVRAVCLLASSSATLRRLFSWPGVVRWVAAAVTVVLLLVTLPQLLRKPAAPAGVGLAGDLNRNGQVDILDAFALARQLKAGTHPGADWDINGDGVVDERDVAALAARAVSLGKGGRS